MPVLHVYVMSTKGDTRIWEPVSIPDTVDGINSSAFTMPRGAKTLIINCPALTSSATLKIQNLDPQASDKDSDTWRDLYAVVIQSSVLAYSQLTGIPSNQATVIPVPALGAGIFRFVASVAQTGAIGNKTILLSWGFDG